ncbi:MAG TPA: hypothetical protein VGJ88_00150 [Thermoanaerobaculia bacterium]|jgi:hypothetical protein
MRIASGRVVAGKIEVEGEPLPDGMIVTLLARDTDEPFEVDPVLKAELLASIAEADRGELIPAEDVWKKLRERH